MVQCAAVAGSETPHTPVEIRFGPEGLMVTASFDGVSYTFTQLAGGTKFWAKVIRDDQEDGDEISIGFLLRLLDGHPSGAPAASAIREAIGSPEALEILEGLDWTYKHFRYYAPSSCAPGRRRFAKAFPFLALALPGHGMTLPEGIGEDPGETLFEYLRVAFEHGPYGTPDVTRKGILAVSSLGWAVPDFVTLSALMSIPRDWLPPAGPEREAFARIVAATAPLVPLAGGFGFLRTSKGRWQAFEEALGDGEGHSLETRVSGVVDMCEAYRSQVVRPSIESLGADPELPEEFHDLPRAERPPSTLGLAFEHLVGGKGLAGMLEASERWHARNDVILDGLARLGGVRTPVSWPVPFAPMVAPNGVEIRFLGDAVSLRDEGRKGPDAQGMDGLAHCVGTYDVRAARGTLAIASLRRPSPKGAVRLSTVAIEVEGVDAVKVSQHHGRRNGSPPRDAAKALSWFMGEVAAGRARADMAYLETGWRMPVASPRARKAGYDASKPDNVEQVVALWHPLLPRPLREPGVVMTDALRAKDQLISSGGCRVAPGTPAPAHARPPGRATKPWRVLGLLGRAMVVLAWVPVWASAHAVNIACALLALPARTTHECLPMLGPKRSERPAMEGRLTLTTPYVPTRGIVSDAVTYWPRLDRAAWASSNRLACLAAEFAVALGTCKAVSLVAAHYLTDDAAMPAFLVGACAVAFGIRDCIRPGPVIASFRFARWNRDKAIAVQAATRDTAHSAARATLNPEPVPRRLWLTS